MKPKFNNLYLFSYGAIGDFCLALYFLKEAHRGLLQTHITVLTTRNEKLLREMSALYPFVRIERITIPAIARLFLKSLWGRNLFIIPPTFFDVPQYVAILARIFTLWRGTIVGFTSKARTPQYDVVVPFSLQDSSYKNFLAILKHFDVPFEDGLRLEFKEDSSILKTLSAPYIALAPFGSSKGKSLPPSRWVALLKFLQTQFPEVDVAILGGPAESANAQGYVEQSGHLRARVLCDIPFAQTVAVISHTPCFIGIDSGLTHVAGVLHRPTVAIENLRGGVAWWPRYNPHAVILIESRDCLCRGDKEGECYREIDGIKYLRCLVDIPQEKIEQAIVSMMENYD